MRRAPGGMLLGSTATAARSASVGLLVVLWARNGRASVRPIIIFLLLLRNVHFETLNIYEIWFEQD
jgi:hypothetical protein